jgi:hypothetical protein
MSDRRGLSHLTEFIGFTMSIKRTVNAMATLLVPEVTLLGAVTSDYLRGKLRGYEYSIT